jgi:hypothetical protein
MAIALRPTADMNIPGRAGPRSANGESPAGKSGKNGIVVAPLANTGAATATGAPGARGGSCASNGAPSNNVNVRAGPKRVMARSVERDRDSVFPQSGHRKLVSFLII